MSEKAYIIRLKSGNKIITEAENSYRRRSKSKRN